MSDSLRPHESQHARPPRPSPTPRVHSDSRPSSQWCHPAISSSVIPFSSCPQSLPASESFPMSQFFTWGGQSTGVSALASFLPKKSQGWSPSLGIANYQLNNLFNTLKGDPDLNSLHSLSQEAWEELYLVQNKLWKQFLTLIKLDLLLELFILPSLRSPTGLLDQQEHSVEWIYIRFKGIKSLTPYLDFIALIIIHGKNRTKTLIGSDSHKTVVPINKSQFESTLQTSTYF